MQLNYTNNLAKKSVKMVSLYVELLRQHTISTTWAKTVPAWAGHWIFLFPPSRNVRKFSPKIKLFLLLKWQPYALNQQGNYFAGHSDPEECLITLSFPLIRQESISSLLLVLQSDQHMCSSVDHPTNIIWPTQSKPKNGGMKRLPNAGTHLQDYKVPQPRKQQCNRDQSLFMSQHDSFYLCLKMYQNLASCFQYCILFPGH